MGIWSLLLHAANIIPPIKNAKAGDWNCVINRKRKSEIKSISYYATFGLLLSIISSEDKCVQTTFNQSKTTDSTVGRNDSLASLSSSSTSIQTDSLENKSTASITMKTNAITQNSANQRLLESYYKWPYIYGRLLAEQTCIYWVNYLGKMKWILMWELKTKSDVFSLNISTIHNRLELLLKFLFYSFESNQILCLKILMFEKQ